MPPRYQVRIKNTAGVQTALLTEWKRLEYTLRVNAPHSHVLLLGKAQNVVAAEFVLDAQVEVWRSDLAIGLTPYLDYEGFHRTPVEQTTASGDVLFTSYGQGYMDLLARRAILYPAGSAYVAKSGPGETVVKSYVDENAGPAATDPPRLADGVTAGLSIAADTAGGTAWEGSRAWRNLLEVCQEIADAARVDCSVVGTGPATFVFDAVPWPIGEDRSTVGLDPTTGLNTAGNAPVVFAVGFGNMAEPVYSLNRTNEVNVVAALGQGLESAREVAIVSDAPAVAASPWNRREATRNANTEAETAGLEAAAEAVLHDLKAASSFSFRVMQTAASRYGRDYRCGDVVTARYSSPSGSVERHYQITAVTVVVAEGHEDITVEVTNATVAS